MTAKTEYLSVQSLGLRSRLQAGITWNIVGTIFTQGSLFLSNIIIANILGRNVFGEFGIIQSTLVTVSGVAQLATGFAATKYVAEYRFVDKDKVGRILGLCAVVSIIMGCIATIAVLAGAPWLALHTFKAPSLSTGLMISSGVIFFSVMNGYQTGALSGLEGYRAIAWSGSIHSFFHLIICSLTAWMWGLDGVLLGFALSSFYRWFIFNRALRWESQRHSIEIIYKEFWNERHIIINFALPAALSGLFSMPAIWLANTFLVRQENGFSQMGLYSAANSLRTIVLFLPFLVNNVGMSLLNSQRGIGDEIRYRKVFWFNLIMTAGIVTLSAMAISFLGPWLLLLFGKDFKEGHAILLVLMLSTIPEALALASYQIIQAQGKMWLSFSAIVLPRDLINIFLSYFLIQIYGALGLAFAYTISQTLSFLIITIIVYSIGLNIKAPQKIRVATL